MKFISWNVNGLKKCIEKGDFENTFKELDADFFCIQEVKSSKEILFNCKGYMQFWNLAKVKNGYSGTAIFTTKMPNNVIYGMQDEYGNNLDQEGRILTLEYPDFFLVDCYVPNSKASKNRLNYRLEFDEYFKNYIDKLNTKKNIVLCGDMNIAYKKIDICPNYRSFSVKENEFHNEEKVAFEELLNIGLVDTFRYFHPQQQKFSWWFQNDENRKKNIGWRLDYFLISNELKKRIRKADVLDNIFGSDHCPIDLILEN